MGVRSTARAVDQREVGMMDELVGVDVGTESALAIVGSHFRVGMGSKLEVAEEHCCMRAPMGLLQRFAP